MGKQRVKCFIAGQFGWKRKMETSAVFSDANLVRMARTLITGGGTDATNSEVQTRRHFQSQNSAMLRTYYGGKQLLFACRRVG